MPRRVRRMSTASRLTGGTGSASHGSLSDLLLGNRRSLGRRRSGRRSSGKSWGTGGSSAGESSDLLADVGRAITPRPLPPALEELRAREGVAVIDFAFLAVSSTVVGRYVSWSPPLRKLPNGASRGMGSVARGASCTVYRGKLKGSAVAVKSFTPTSVTPLDVRAPRELCFPWLVRAHCTLLRRRSPFAQKRPCVPVCRIHAFCTIMECVSRHLVSTSCSSCVSWVACTTSFLSMARCASCTLPFAVARIVSAGCCACMQGWDLAQRLLMALCGAEALAYLHEFTPPIIHHDVKVSAWKRVAVVCSTHKCVHTLVPALVVWEFSGQSD